MKKTTKIGISALKETLELIKKREKEIEIVEQVIKEPKLEKPPAQKKVSSAPRRKKVNQKALNELKLLATIKPDSKPKNIENCAEKKEFKLRAPILCVLGHVDTGKTKLLDNLRNSTIQQNEVGGITQQIGATNVPFETVFARAKFADQVNIPGLLIIDTPGHESFKMLRSRGSLMCDMAILVIDIMHGLESQTIESINTLRENKIPFLIAMNKIDRLFGWKSSPDEDVFHVISNQTKSTIREFEMRCSEIICQMAEQGLNAALVNNNANVKKVVSIVPVSAQTGDGLGNLFSLIVDFSQQIISKQLKLSTILQCSVMEVKKMAGFGTTIDVCLRSGTIKVSDKIVLAGHEGPIVTEIRSLLLPEPNKEFRVKNSYKNFVEATGSQTIKIVAKELEKALAGHPLFVARTDEEVEKYKEELKHVKGIVKYEDVGVSVHTSTMGSLEALVEFLKTSKIPVASVCIGDVFKKDVIKASLMIKKDAQYAVILAFDVKIEKDAQEYAQNLNLKIFSAEIIYHLFDKFLAFKNEFKQKKKDEVKDEAIFPFKASIIPQYIFNARDPIIVGVRVESGSIRIGAPICAISDGKIVDLGKVVSIQNNSKPTEIAKQGQEVCIKIENTTGSAPKLIGRHFLETDQLVSKISRTSIDVLKDYFRDDMTKPDWYLVKELKPYFQI